MTHWASDSIFYHIYPLGFCGAPPKNDFHSPAEHRLNHVYGWLDHIQSLGVNAIYLGPLFESSTHGYDTVDYYHVDRRLGNNQTLTDLSAELHRRGIRLILDGVFNHVGRDFWAFYDLRQNLEQSPYRDWFHNLRFGEQSPYGDPFAYEGWSGHYGLVKLNLQNPDVRAHLFNAVEMWIREFDIDGLRLDAADVMDIDFLKDLSAHCRRIRPDFWLVGEIVHGDYRNWANPDTLDSVTNYECYKGLYSSHNDRNYFEIAYAFNRQFGENGLYQNLPLYAFADNHDVDRVASSLAKPEHLYPLYSLLFTMPGVPSIYYGSEWGIKGKRTNHSDRPMRPHLVLEEMGHNGSKPDLVKAIQHLARIRQHSHALRYGSYQQLHVADEQLAFMRESPDEKIIVAVNASDQPIALDLPFAANGSSQLVDLLNEGDRFPINEGKARIAPLPPTWARIMQVR